MKSQKDLLRTLVDLLDGIVEVFLASVIEPLLIWHGKVDRFIDKGFRRFVNEYKDRLPTWILQKRAITYGRMGLALPTMVLLSWDCSLLASSLVLVELAASFWERVIPDIACDRYCTDGEDYKNEGEQGEEESFEVVTTGSPHSVPSWVGLHRARTYTGWAGTMVDRAFALFCCISLLHFIPRTGQFHVAQYMTMTALVAMETVHACLSFRKFWTTNLLTTLHMDDVDLFRCRMSHVQLEKIKLLFELGGIALFMLPITRYLGLSLLVVVVPVEYELVRDAGRKRVFYHVETGKSFDHKTVKIWMQMKSLASKLVVGVPRRDAMDMVMNACASSVVDEVIVEAPTKVDLHFIEKQRIDFVVIVTPVQTNVVTDEVISANRVLLLNEGGHLRRVRPKSVEHQQ